MTKLIKIKDEVIVDKIYIEVFVKMREMLSAHKDILLKLEQIENRVGKHGEDLHLIFEALKELLNPKSPPRNPIGFKVKR